MKERVVLLRDHASADHHDVVSPGLGQGPDQQRDQRLVARGLGRHPDHVHVVLDGLTRGILRRLEEGPDVHVEA